MLFLCLVKSSGGSVNTYSQHSIHPTLLQKMGAYVNCVFERATDRVRYYPVFGIT